jgi:hypothetical protein
VIIGLTIDKDKFEQGQPARALYNQILEFLENNSDKAYTQTEITHEMLQAKGTDGVLQMLTSVGIQAFVLATLDNLIADTKVTARRPGAYVYYMAAQHGAEPSSKVGASST